MYKMGKWWSSSAVHTAWMPSKNISGERNRFPFAEWPRSSGPIWTHPLWSLPISTTSSLTSIYTAFSLCYQKDMDQIFQQKLVLVTLYPSSHPYEISFWICLKAPHAKSWLIGKDSDAGRDWGQEEKGTTEDEMAGWHHWLDGHESQWTPGVGDGQGGLACCNSWDCKELDTTERLIWSDLIWKAENPLNSMDIKPVNPKGNQPWIFIGKTEAETPVNLAPWCEALTHWKRPWCSERLKAGGEVGIRGWDSWMATLTHGQEFEQTLGDSEG